MALTANERALLRLSTAIVLGAWDEVRRVRAAGAPDRAWREAVRQTHLFAGFPRLVEAYGVLEELGGLGAPDADELEEGAVDPARGAALFERIYGARSDDVRALLRAGDPDFARWIAEHAYARVLARPGLGADRRELLAACALAALGQERQLAGHARGSLRCGASFDELVDALAEVRDLMPAERHERALRLVERFR